MSPTAAIAFPFEEKPTTNAALVKPESFKKLRRLIDDVCCIVKDFLKNYFIASCSNTVHRLLCHSLVRSELCSANLLQLKCATQQKFNAYSSARLIKIFLVSLIIFSQATLFLLRRVFLNFLCSPLDTLNQLNQAYR